MAGFPLAALGYLFNFIPYQFCSIILHRFRKADEAAMATFKVIYSILVYPLFYIGECILIHRLFGWIISASFAVAIIPLSYITIFYFEWLYDAGLGIPVSPKWLNNIRLRRISKRLDELHTRINKQMEDLSSRLRMEKMEGSGN